MKSDKRRLIVITVVLIAVFVAAALWYRRNEQTEADRIAAENAERLVRPYSVQLGPSTAPVTVVEFLDPECETCAAMHPITKRVMQEFEGKVRLVIRYMPFHPNAAYAAGLLEGARAQDKFWPLWDAFVTNHPEWASHGAPRPELLMTYVTGLGLDTQRVVDVAKGEETQRRIRQDHMDGIALGVRQTPTFFVNGRVLPRLGYDPLRTAIQDALSAVR
jgi:protein-disulfide isomerase